MKFRTIFILFFIFSKVEAQEDYTLIINNTAQKISLDKKYEIIVDGKKMEVSVKLNDTLTYDDYLVHFSYLSSYKITKTRIDEGIEQLLIMTAEGSGIIIQQYSKIDPTSLNEIMLTELTKESVNYGYDLKRKDYKRKIKSGQSVNVDKAVLNYKGDIHVYEVSSLGNKDEGILIVTMRMEDKKNSDGEKLIDLMWKSVEFK